MHKVVSILIGSLRMIACFNLIAEHVYCFPLNEWRSSNNDFTIYFVNSARTTTKNYMRGDKRTHVWNV